MGFHSQIEQQRKDWQEENRKNLEKLKLDQQSEMQMKLSELDKLQKSNIESMWVVWNEDHNNFSIYTEPCFDLPLHFLHNESTHLLGLTIPPNNASKRYTSAEVLDKEYCQAKKSENRFRVPQGTKFYRVRCKPATIKDKDIMTKSNGKND